MSKTERVRVRFTVKETDGNSWIAMDPIEAGSILKGVLLGFDLRTGTSFDEAEKIAAYLNSNVAEVNYTRIS